MKWLFALMMMGLSLPAFAVETVAVFYFDSSTAKPELQGLKVGMAQMLITDLSQDDSFKVVERAQLQAILDEHKLGYDGITSKDTAARIGRLLGARRFIFGNLFEFGGQLQIDARLVDVETGEILKSHGVRGKVEEFFKLEKELASFSIDAIRSLPTVNDAPRAIPQPEPTRNERGRPGAAPASNDGAGMGDPALDKPDAEALGAAMAFSDGLVFMDAGDKPKARESFEKALAKRPNLQDAKVALASLSL